MMKAFLLASYLTFVSDRTLICSIIERLMEGISVRETGIRSSVTIRKFV